MSKSPFFARIRGDVVAILASVPAGQVVTFADIGAHLDVPARHVAYILSRRDDPALLGIDPERAVATADTVGRTVVAVAALAHGVPKQQRPADAPVSRQRKRRI